MNEKLRRHALEITAESIRRVLPDAAVRRALEGREFPGRVVIVAVGKAAWRMAKAAAESLTQPAYRGVVITKYGHSEGEIPGCVCMEAGHPVPDENSFRGAEAAIEAVRGLTERDTVLFLLSGGGSALFEKPLVSPEDLQDVTGKLLACGADIVEINTIRKRLSGVKGGRFAELCAPAHVLAIILSDIVGDPVDSIASGPAYPDSSTCARALAVVEKYGFAFSEPVMECLTRETPKTLSNVETLVTGSVRELCAAAAEACRARGYEPTILTDTLGCEARQAGAWLGEMAAAHAGDGKKLAFLAGGETVVRLTGKGLGGRNQEIALAAAEKIAGLENVCVFSVGSDGTDGPTDAAGGYADGETKAALEKRGVRIPEVLADNDAYHALKAVDGLIVTGPTGTNVNDVSAVLIEKAILSETDKE